MSGTTADAVFAGCSRRAITAAVQAPVPRPEHLVAMKAQAFAKDGTRYSDLADLGYLESAGLAEYFDRLRRR